MANVEVATNREPVQMSDGTPDLKNEAQSGSLTAAAMMIVEGVAIAQQASKEAAIFVPVPEMAVPAKAANESESETTKSEEESEEESDSDIDFPQWNGPRPRGKPVTKVSGRKDDKKEKEKKEKERKEKEKEERARKEKEERERKEKEKRDKQAKSARMSASNESDAVIISHD
ncbi:unnamed protein product [Cyclocybe aegerita]|uniref:Uncharacterized protein n=1 Tax=Cyclocybe aegerita TaxID=1973307 RepID=A0A8S0VUH1_CYCAE|nr:unnamed protein product [Cyclocybe aegerita]